MYTCAKCGRVQKRKPKRILSTYVPTATTNGNRLTVDVCRKCVRKVNKRVRGTVIWNTPSIRINPNEINRTWVSSDESTEHNGWSSVGYTYIERPRSVEYGSYSSTFGGDTE